MSKTLPPGTKVRFKSEHEQYRRYQGLPSVCTIGEVSVGWEGTLYTFKENNCAGVSGGAFAFRVLPVIPKPISYEV